MVMTVKLFSYGTLQLEEIQVATVGRTLINEPDALVGYRVTMIPIEDHEVREQLGLTHYLNIEHSGVATDVVEGSVLSITQAELEQADVYEEAAKYVRIEVELKSGVKAWVYLRRSKTLY